MKHGVPARAPRAEDNNDDEVLPLHPFDDNTLCRQTVPSILMSFPSLLDPAKLGSSLETLLRMPGWRRLGGRARLDEPTNRVSIHIPRRFSPNRPALRFLHTNLGTRPIGDHPEFASLGRPTALPSVQASSRDVIGRQAILQPPGWPRTASDFLDPERDEPMIALHVLTFADATMVMVSVSHLVVDGGTFIAMMQGWMAVLNGKPDEVPPVRNASCHHPFGTVLGIAQEPSGPIEAEPSVLEDKKIDLASFQIPETTAATAEPKDWNPSEPGSGWRSIFLPAAAVSLLIREAKATLPSQSSQSSSSSSSSSSANHAFSFSPEDVLVSWLSRTIASAVPDTTRSFNVMRIFDARRVLVPSVLPPGAYLGNLFHTAWHFSPSSDELARSTLGSLALQARDAVRTQTTPSQTAASLVHRAEAGGVALYGDPRGLVFASNSWGKIGSYRNAGFGAAVVGGGGGGGGSSRQEEQSGTMAVPPGSPDYFEPIINIDGAPPGPAATFTGFDWAGNTWIHAYQTGSFWKATEVELDRLGREMARDAAAAAAASAASVGVRSKL